MKKDRVILSVSGIKDFYKSCCEDEGCDFRKKDLEEFVEWCERDIYEWLNENWRTFTEDK